MLKLKAMLKKILVNICQNYPAGTVRLNVNFLNKFLLYEALKFNQKKKLSVLDIGCGYNSLIRYNDFIYKVGYDGYEKSLKIAKKSKTHDKYILGKFDELDKKFSNRKFDFIIAIDFIEHLTKKDGYKLLNFIESRAKLGAAIFTPNGFLFQPSVEQGDFMKHLSGWNKKDFIEKGYTVYGATGLKYLRKEFHEIKYKPKFLWSVISYFSQILFVKKFPDYAAALWAIKRFNKK